MSLLVFNDNGKDVEENVAIHDIGSKAIPDMNHSPESSRCLMRKMGGVSRVGSDIVRLDNRCDRCLTNWTILIAFVS